MLFWLTDICIDIKHGNNGGELPSWGHLKAARGEQDRGAAGGSGQPVPGRLISQLGTFSSQALHVKAFLAGFIKSSQLLMFTCFPLTD